jgi:hypothetical protein
MMLHIQNNYGGSVPSGEVLRLPESPTDGLPFVENAAGGAELS